MQVEQNLKMNAMDDVITPAIFVKNMGFYAFFDEKILRGERNVVHLCALKAGNDSICPYLPQICPLTAFREILHWKIHDNRRSLSNSFYTSITNGTEP